MIAKLSDGDATCKPARDVRLRPHHEVGRAGDSPGVGIQMPELTGHVCRGYEFLDDEQPDERVDEAFRGDTAETRIEDQQIAGAKFLDA